MVEATTAVISMAGQSLVTIGAVIEVDFQTVEVMDIRGPITMGVVVEAVQTAAGEWVSMGRPRLSHHGCLLLLEDS